MGLDKLSIRAEDWSDFLHKRVGLVRLSGVSEDFLGSVKLSMRWMGLVKPSIGEDVVRCLGGIRIGLTLVGEIGICETFSEGELVGQTSCRMSGTGSMPRQDSFFGSRQDRTGRIKLSTGAGENVDWGEGVKLSARKNKIVQTYCGKEIEIFLHELVKLISSRQDWSGAAGIDHNLHN